MYLTSLALVAIVDEVVGGFNVDWTVLFIAVVLFGCEAEPLPLVEVYHSPHSDDKVSNYQAHYFHKETIISVNSNTSWNWWYNRREQIPQTASSLPNHH